MLYLRSDNIGNSGPNGKAERLRVVSVHEESDKKATPASEPSGGSAFRTAGTPTGVASGSTPNSPVESTTTDPPISLHFSSELHGVTSSQGIPDAKKLLDDMIKAHVRPGLLPILYDQAAEIITRAFRVLPSDHRVTVRVPGQIKRRRDDA